MSKQTTETLMAGERIMEALELADAEREAQRAYEAARAGGGLAADVAPPPRHPVLAAHDVEPERYVLRVVERVPGTALYDALLVLPFGKVVSLMMLPTPDTVQAVRICTEPYSDALPAVPMHEAT